MTPGIALSSASVLSWCVSPTAKGVHSIKSRPTSPGVSLRHLEIPRADASHPRCLPTSTSHCLADVDLFPDLMLIPLLPSHPGRLMTCRGSLTDCILLGLRSSPLHHDRPENTTDAVIHDSLPSYYSSSAYALQSTRCRNSRGYIPTAQMLYTRANHGKSL